MEINISSFFTWFLSQFYSIFSKIFILLDSIIIAPGVSMLDFSITIIILGFVVSILIASPGNAMRVEKGIEARENAKARANARKGKGN